MGLKKAVKDDAINRWLSLPWGPNAPPSIPPMRSSLGSSSAGGPSSSPPSVGSIPAGFPSLPETEEPFHEWREMVPSFRHKRERSTDPNARKTRGFNSGQAGQRLVEQTQQKMWLDYYEATAGPRKQDVNNKVTREVGAVVRSKVHMIAPTFYELPPHEQYRVLNCLSDHFNYDPEDMMLKKWLIEVANGAYLDFKHDAHKAYLKWGPTKIPEDFCFGRNSSWTYLCEHFESPEYKRRSAANKRNRGELKHLHRTGPVAIAYRVQRIREDKNRFAELKAYEEVYVKGATSGECFDNNEAIWAEVKRRLTAYKELHPDCPDDEAENVVEADTIEILEQVVGRRKGNEIRAMGRAGKSYASQDSLTGISRRRRKSSTATQSVSQPEPSNTQLKAIIKKQKGKLAKLGRHFKAFACLLPQLLSATGVEANAEVAEALEEAANEADDEDEAEEEEDEEVEHMPIDLSAAYSQVGPAHSRGSGGIVMMPTPGLQPRSSHPQPSIGKGKGIAQEDDEEIDTD